MTLHPNPAEIDSLTSQKLDLILIQIASVLVGAGEDVEVIAGLGAEHCDAIRSLRLGRAVITLVGCRMCVGFTSSPNRSSGPPSDSETIGASGPPRALNAAGTDNCLMTPRGWFVSLDQRLKVQNGDLPTQRYER